MTIKELSEQIIKNEPNFNEDLESILTQWVEELIGEDEVISEEERKVHPELNLTEFCDLIDKEGRNSFRADLRTKAGLTPPQKGDDV